MIIEMIFSACCKNIESKFSQNFHHLYDFFLYFFKKSQKKVLPPLFCKVEFAK